MPRGRYTVRVKDATFGPSKSSGNPMITLDCEIIEPEFVTVQGVKYPLDQVKVMYYLILVEAKGHLAKIVGPPSPSLMERLGLANEIDDENPNTKQFEGLVFDAILSSREKLETIKDSVTGQFVPLLDGEGKQIKRGYELNTQIDDILGRSAVKAGNVPF